MRARAGLCVAAAAIVAAVATRCGRGTAPITNEESTNPGADAGTGTTQGGADAGAPDAGAPDGGNPDGGTAGPPPPVLVDPQASDVERHPATRFGGASIDEGGFLWAVSTDALWLLRPGSSSWERYGNSNSGGILGNGHQNDGVLSVAGGAPGEAWVGYRGLFYQDNENDDPNVVPEYIRTSGGADHVVATPDGIALVEHVVFWTPAGVLKAEPLGRWKVRSIFTILYDHRPGPHQGDVFFGGNHGVGLWNPRIQAMQEHAHSAWNYCPGGPECTLMCGDHHGLALPPDGNLWMGADFGAERLDYIKGGIDGRVDNDVDVPRPDGLRLWVNRSLDNQHPEWGGRDFIMAMAFDAYGDLWVGSYFNGIARVKMDGSYSTAKSQKDVDYWANRSWAHKPPWGSDGDYVWSLAADPDGSVWIGGAQNAWRFVAATGQFVSYRSVIPGQNVNQISLDPSGKRGVVFATDAGAFVFRGK